MFARGPVRREDADRHRNDEPVGREHRLRPRSRLDAGSGAGRACASARATPPREARSATPTGRRRSPVESSPRAPTAPASAIRERRTLEREEFRGPPRARPARLRANADRRRMPGPARRTWRARAAGGRAALCPAPAHERIHRSVRREDRGGGREQEHVATSRGDLRGQLEPRPPADTLQLDCGLVDTWKG